MADDSPLTGRCNCGAVRYEVHGPLLTAGYCHCTRCQRRTGTAASPSAKPAPGAFRIVAGEDRLRSWTPDDGFEKWFCGDCGSAMFSRNPDNHDAVAVRMGTFDEDPGIRPGFHQFVAYAAPWKPIPDDGLPRHPERAADR
ncbi:MAG: GFA family protein [Actinomycetota bacterium]|nr:GFA family protein [Actinomycetota bacterium]